MKPVINLAAVRIKPDKAIDPACCAACAAGAISQAVAPPSEGEDKQAAKGLRIFLLTLSLAALVVLVLYLAPLPRLAQTLLALGTSLFLGWKLAWNALRNLAMNRVFDENLLMTIAVVGALVLGDFNESVLVLVLFRIGEYFEERAVDRSRKSIAALIDRRPRRVIVETMAGTAERNPAELQPGEIYLARNGDQLALDGTVVSGLSQLDTSSLTGEALPVEVGPGQRVLSGSINQGEVLRIRVESVYADSTLSRILGLVRDAGANKAKSETFIRRFARWYTPAVALAALALALVPSLVFHQGNLIDWVQRALVFLVISCPCALVISVPLTYFAGIGAAAAAGVLVKGGNHLDSLGRLGVLAFDKTGTLTEGRMKLSAVHQLDGITATEIVALAARAEALSSHPVAKAIWLGGGSPAAHPDDRLTETSGRGIVATNRDGTVHVGSAQFFGEQGIALIPAPDTDLLRLHIALGGRHIGNLDLEDPLRPGAAGILAEIGALGVGRTVLLSGDQPRHAQRIAQSLGIGEFHGGLLPADKVRHCEILCLERPRGRTVGFVGDGINDAPVLARADIGIAMGGIGSDAAIDAADVVLMAGNLAHLPRGIRQARKTRAVAAQNIALALGIKVVFLGLGAFGLIGIVLAVFADTGTTVLAVLNSLRARRL